MSRYQVFILHLTLKKIYVHLNRVCMHEYAGVAVGKFKNYKTLEKLITVKVKFTL